MDHVTKMKISVSLGSGESIQDVVSELPEYAASSFERASEGWWIGEFQISCPVAPELADGDLVDDFSPHFPALLRLKEFHKGKFELEIAVGPPAPDRFDLESHSIALLAALGASISVRTKP